MLVVVVVVVVVLVAVVVVVVSLVVVLVALVVVVVALVVVVVAVVVDVALVVVVVAVVVDVVVVVVVVYGGGWEFLNGITTWFFLSFSKVISKMFHELAPARSSNILSSQSPLSPPNSKTPLPSGDSAIALSLTA